MSRFILNNHSFNHSNKSTSIALLYRDLKEKNIPFSSSWLNLFLAPAFSRRMRIYQLCLNEKYSFHWKTLYEVTLKKEWVYLQVFVIEIGLFWKTSQQFSMWFVHSVIPMWNFLPCTVFFLKNTLFITLLKEIVQQFWICNIFLVSQQMKHFL